MLLCGGSTRQVSRYRLNKMDGKCKNCPAPNDAGAYCTKCHDKRAAYYGAQRAARIAAGKCVNGCEASSVGTKR